jgi:hypothetical protein
MSAVRLMYTAGVEKRCHLVAGSAEVNLLQGLGFRVSGVGFRVQG